MLNKLCYTARNALHGENPVAALVPVLSLSCGPVAIVRRVAQVIVSSFNRVLRSWPFSHVGQEVTERIKPSLAHSDSPAVVVSHRGVGTAANHAAPNSEDGALLSNLGVAVDNVCGRSQFPLEASARPANSVGQVSVPDFSKCPTVANTQTPSDRYSGWSSSIASIGQNFPSFKLPTDERYFRGHNASGRSLAATSTYCHYQQFNHGVND